jgi:plasmid stabilization system protein ParE
LRYRVVITPEAVSDLRNARNYIRRDNPRAAMAWLRAARQRIKTLTQHPERCPLAPESASFDEPIRELFFGHGNRGTYRILFVVLGKSVFVLHLRHGAMQPLSRLRLPESPA